MDFDGFSWIFMDFHGFSWILMDFGATTPSWIQWIYVQASDLGARLQAKPLGQRPDEIFASEI